jgi:hypothetical protein
MIGATDGRRPAEPPPALDVEWSNKQVFPGTSDFEMCPKDRLVRDQRARYFCDMWYSMSSKEIVHLVTEWIDDVSKATGQSVVIYTNATAWWNPIVGQDGVDLMKQRPVWNSRYTGAGPVYNPMWTAAGGSPKWKMPPLPLGGAFPVDKFDVGHFWQFSESAEPPRNFLTCEGKSTDRVLDMDWVPVGEEEYQRVFERNQLDQ